MRYAYKNSFNRAFKKLTRTEQLSVESALNSLIDFFERNISQPVGLGLKSVGEDYWEIRSGLKVRILFQIEKDLVTFYFVGNHDEVKRFIRD